MWGRTNHDVSEHQSSKSFPWYTVYSLALGVPYAFLALKGWGLSWSSISAMVGLTAITAVPSFALVIYFWSRNVVSSVPYDDLWIKWTNVGFARRWKDKKIPVRTFYEAYIAQEVDFECDLLQALYHRHSFTRPVFEMWHLSHFLFEVVPGLFSHSQKSDTEIVAATYNLGNDFYNSFLGDDMIYTSGVFYKGNETLHEAQQNKLDKMFKLIHAKPGETIMDVGCGWGTLIVEAAQAHGMTAHGITISKEQAEYGQDAIRKAKMTDKAQVHLCDYRDAPRATNAIKFDKIVSLEMLEHVGIIHYGSALRQIYDQLKDDGVFYMQVAGGRPSWQIEDLLWFCYNSQYIFPGADSSLPVNQVMAYAENAGFEIKSMDNVGIHYSGTIKYWYDNWQLNKEQVISKYGTKAWRIHNYFLGWSVIASESGFASCWQMVMHKNHCKFDRKKLYIPTSI